MRILRSEPPLQEVREKNKTKKNKTISKKLLNVLLPHLHPDNVSKRLSRGWEVVVVVVFKYYYSYQSLKIILRFRKILI